MTLPSQIDTFKNILFKIKITLLGNFKNCFYLILLFKKEVEKIIQGFRKIILTILYLHGLKYFPKLTIQNSYNLVKIVLKIDGLN